MAMIWFIRVHSVHPSERESLSVSHWNSWKEERKEGWRDGGMYRIPMDRRTDADVDDGERDDRERRARREEFAGGEGIHLTSPLWIYLWISNANA